MSGRYKLNKQSSTDFEDFTQIQEVAWAFRRAVTGAPFPLDDAEKGATNFIRSACNTDEPSTPTPSPAVDAAGEVIPAVVMRPKKSGASRGIRFRLWFNTYRKLFTLIVTINCFGILLAAIDKWHYPRRYTGALALGNILAAVLVRNELFGRLLYLIVNTVFAKWPPLWFRLGCTSVLQHLGGIHSGCATSGFLWLFFLLVLIFIDHKDNHDAVLIMGVLTNLAIGIAVISAFPWVRNTHHNIFERHHRFAGWIGVICTWVLVVLGDSYDMNTHSWNPDGIRVFRQQDFWFCLGITIFIVIPWLTIREVEVDVEIPSSKVVILRFKRGMQQGLLARISRSSIMEYHSFGIISEGTKSNEHYLICGVQGDFTRSLHDNPPTTLWTRELKFAGVSNTSTLYKRGVRVCTGTGLGSSLSTCLQSPDWYLLWIGSDQEKTLGAAISKLIYKNLGPERCTLWDSNQRGGRPDLMKLISDVYTSWGAEVVIITSNRVGNKEMMEGCKAAGIPAFGTLWDF